jgi:hypothetical protein
MILKKLKIPDIFRRAKKSRLKMSAAAAVAMFASINTVFPAFAAGGAATGGGGGGGGFGGNPAAPNADADELFSGGMNLIAVWVGRAGIAMIFFGLIGLGWGMKDDDSTKKQAGIMGMIAGAVVLAVTGALDLFGIF